MNKNNNVKFATDLIYSYLSSSKPSFSLNEPFIELCLRNGLGPILADIYLKYDDLTTTELKKRLLSIELTAKYYAAAHNSALQELLDKLNTCSIRIILLKGINHSKLYYPQPHLRLMGDIDILINKESCSIVTEILYTLGYIQKSEMPDEFYNTHQHLKPFYHPEKDIWIEVHTQLFSLKNNFGQRRLFQLNYIFDNQIPVSSERGNLYSLTPELNLVYIITHWVREFRISNSLVQLVDIAILIKNYNIDWQVVITSIQSLDAATEIKLVICFLQKHNIIELPTKVLKEITGMSDSAGIIGHAVLNTILLAFIKDNYFITRFVGVSNCGYIWQAYLQDRRSIFNHATAVKNIIFPPNSGKSVKISPLSRLSHAFKRLKHHPQQK